MFYFKYIINYNILKILYILFYLCNFQQTFGLRINICEFLTLHLLLLNVSSQNQLTFKGERAGVWCSAGLCNKYNQSQTQQEKKSGEAELIYIFADLDETTVVH